MRTRKRVEHYRACQYVLRRGAMRGMRCGSPTCGGFLCVEHGTVTGVLAQRAPLRQDTRTHSLEN